MTFPSLLLRLLLIVALACNGYAAAAMSVGGAHAMHAAMASAGNAASLARAQTAAPTLPAHLAAQGCHEGHGGQAQAGAATEPEAPQAPLPGDPDCCAKFHCQCDCLQVAAIVRLALPAPPVPAHTPPALPLASDAPNGVSSQPIRPPIA